METIHDRSTPKVRVPMLPLLIVLGVGLGAAGAWMALQSWFKDPLLTDHLTVPLGEITSAAVEINAGDGNLRVDPLTGSEAILASGSLQYGQKQGTPTRSVEINHGQAVLLIKANRSPRPGQAFPWAASSGASEWTVSLNAGIPLDITADSSGGNIALNLAGTSARRIRAGTGGGNIDLTLPDSAAGLIVTAETGAGNVTVHIPSGLAARVHATTGLGKINMSPEFSKIDDQTFQSPDYNTAVQTIELTLQSGAGNVSVSTP